MSIRHRILGLAFASGDLLLELTADGTVALALGAGPAAGCGLEAFQSKRLADRLISRDGRPVLELLGDIKPGARKAIDILFDCGDGKARRATLGAFMLPDLAPNVSCSVSYQGPVFTLDVGDTPELIGTEAFLSRARNAMNGEGGGDLSVSFIDVIGLTASGEAGARAAARIESALQSASIDGSSAARLAPDRYAVLRDTSDTRDVAGEVGELARDEGLSLDVSSSQSRLTGSVPVNALRALRFAIETCLKDNGEGQPNMAFDTALARTLREADQFRAVIRDKDFALHYQPIVALDSGAVHHFEALARFGGGPTAGTIQMAEELALIEGFDLAVAEKALQRLRAPGSGLIKIAINVSGASLSNDSYVQQLLRMTASAPLERRRLIVEVTESVALADVDAANRRLRGLREAGISLCIDDFGAGSASFDYVRGLSVDTVKIDGKFVKGLETDSRAQTLIAHLTELCGSLKLTTIAEMIETQAAADILRSLGVDYGQGWLFGKAEAEPRTVLPANDVSSRARRRGAVEAWG